MLSNKLFLQPNQKSYRFNKVYHKTELQFSYKLLLQQQRRCKTANFSIYCVLFLSANLFKLKYKDFIKLQTFLFEQI